MALHDEAGPVCSAVCGCIDCGYESIIVGTGESLCTPCGSLTSVRAPEPQRCLLIVFVASAYSANANLPLDSRGTEGIPDLHLL